MAATHDTHHLPAARRTITSALGLFWFFVTAGLALTASLIVLGGTRIVESGAVRAVLTTLLVLFAIHAAGQFRHRHEPITDERLVKARERRGF